MINVTECPRDAMQGISRYIKPAVKVEYINKLLQCGFEKIDFGSFVSPKAVPQMRDTAEVLRSLRIETNSPKLVAIVANARGAADACEFDEIDYLGFPFSISEQFQKRNTNSSITESLIRVEEIKSKAEKSRKKLLIYISMAFGNPYGEEWHPDIASKWTETIHKEFNVTDIALSDTTGTSNKKSIEALFSTLIPALPEITFGAHLHTTPETWREKIDAAYKAGCRHFDSAIMGYGGCPMATDDLTGNMPTEKMLGYFDEIDENTGIDKKNFNEAQLIAKQVFKS